MKLPANTVKHFVFGAIFGVALLLGFGANEARGQTYQDRYYDDQDRYYNDRRYNNRNNRRVRHHQPHEKRDLKHHQRHEREEYGNSRWLREHQRQEKRQLKHHQRHENQNSRRSSRRVYYPFNY